MPLYCCIIDNTSRKCMSKWWNLCKYRNKYTRLCTAQWWSVKVLSSNHPRGVISTNFSWVLSSSIVISSAQTHIIRSVQRSVLYSGQASTQSNPISSDRGSANHLHRVSGVSCVQSSPQSSVQSCPVLSYPSVVSSLQCSDRSSMPSAQSIVESSDQSTAMSCSAPLFCATYWHVNVLMIDEETDVRLQNILDGVISIITVVM